ncbi:MAG TPA: TetR/AcrR family transcriptional regulator [Candidatus Acidoferrales bacterium]|nr:TetR/AcrR family transcriptional regulator [Candidatus Acidoferrales bacterium]
MIGPRPSPSRLPAPDRRRRLLDSALDLFAHKGFNGTTTREIAAAAGVTEAIVFRHFPNKHALYSAVLDLKHESGEVASIVAGWQALMDANDDEGLFRAIIQAILHNYRRDTRINRVLLFAALEGHEAGLEQHRQRSLPVFERLCQYVARRQSEGAIRPGDPGAIVTAGIAAAAYYVQMTELFGFRPDTADTQMAEEFVRILMNGIRLTA